MFIIGKSVIILLKKILIRYDSILHAWVGESLSKKQKKKKSIWLALSIVVGILVAAAAIIGLIINLQSGKLSSSDREVIEQIKENPPTNVSEQAGTLIAEYHAKYNKLTGYGSIDQLDENSAIRLSGLLEKDMEKVMNQEISNKDLAADLEEIYKLAVSTKTQAHKEQVRLIHRYFHDLDIAVNQYKETNEIFGVTKTLGK